ncbi:MAG: double-strand break repair protein AddB, partial [Pseudomonadota bacterium]
QRSAKALTRALQQGSAVLFPKLKTFDGLARDAGLMPPRSALARSLDLSALVARLLKADPSLGSAENAFDLAQSLGAVLDEMAAEGVSVERLRGLPPDALQAHWQKSLAFLDLVHSVGAALGVDSSAEVLQVKAVAELVENWQEVPPHTPILAAGSTASRRPTARLMAAIARLDQGAVILPGLDRNLPLDAIEHLIVPETPALDHPQAMMVRFLDHLGLRPGDVPLWHEDSQEDERTHRHALLSLALRPAPVTESWLRDGPSLVPTLAKATAQVTLVEAPTQHAEATTLAWAIRAALQEDKSVALISADRGLTRRVQTALSTWSLVADDSAGRPLQLTPPGVYLRLVLTALAAPPSPAALAGLLKHPITATGSEDQRKSHLMWLERFEHEVLRSGVPTLDCASLSKTWATSEEDHRRVAWLAQALAPLTPQMSLAERWQHHLRAAELMARGPEGDAGSEELNQAGALWDQAAGRKCEDVFRGLGADLGDTVLDAPDLYNAILKSVLGSAEVPDRASEAHPKLAILGPREARMESADLVILASLNEDSWPRQPQPDPWLSRGMRAALGLMVPERQMGLSAHDFQQGTGAPEVILSRSCRDASAPTVPSRWLMRLTNLMAGLGPDGQTALADMRARGRSLSRMALAVQPHRPSPRAARPQPRPPAFARPKQLSVTRVETLIRDPYAIYASHVLGLRALDPLSRDADALLRGTAFHEVLERFITATKEDLPPAQEALVLWHKTVRETLAERVPWHAERVFWTSRLSRAGPAFLDGEADRRADGVPFKFEVTGQRSLAEGAFSLTAKADRIDQMPSGQIALYDYKSGDPPGPKALAESHIQILLEAGIALAGGFQDVPPAHTGRAEIIGLKADGKTRKVPLDLEGDWPKVEALIARLLDPQEPMRARLRPHAVVDDTYNQLARYGEWEDGDP